MDPIDAVAAVRRSVTTTTAEDGRDARAVVAERTYPAPAADVSGEHAAGGVPGETTEKVCVRPADVTAPSRWA